METFVELHEIFKKIKEKGFIKQDYQDSGGAGKMLEKLLGKKMDNKSRPDYKNVELKVSNEKAKYPITLISIVPYNKMEVNSVEYLIRNYSHNGCNKDNKNSKYLNGNINTKELKFINKKTAFKLSLDKKSNRLYLHIIQNNKVIDDNIYWNLNDVKDKIKWKMEYLIIAINKSKKVNDEVYCKYTDFQYYKLKDFNFFIDAIEKGNIEISFNIKIDNNKITYRGIRFCISIEKIKEIYTKVYINN